MHRFSQRLLDYLPDFDRRVWILILGRLLSQVGNGFTLFYAPIFFVNQVGLSATAVGLGIGSGSIAGVVGRIVGGTWADSPRWGRRRTLLIAAAVSALADLVLVLAQDFPWFLVGNLLMGLGIGLYWPATEAMVADLSTIPQRNEAFALTRLGDSLGLGLGVILGGLLISLTANYRALFWIDGISFLIFFGIIYGAIAETRPSHHGPPALLKSWMIALSDRALLIYVLVNLLFTTYLALITSALPLYFTSFIPLPNARGFSTATISALFSWHVLLTVVLQLPVARALNRMRRPVTLALSAVLWGVGFGLTWATGVVAGASLLWASLSLGVLGLATVVYMPSASSLVVALAPVSLRGVYLSINSLCWAFGYFAGPALGGWAMDQSPAIAHGFWIATALSMVVSLVILQRLDQVLMRSPRLEEE